MAEYPVFQQVQPNIDVHLFGDAAQTGAKLGQEIPNPITSAITGAQEGYKLGVQEAQISAQTDNEQALAQIHQLEAQREAATQTEQIQEQKADLTFKTKKAEEDANDITEENKFWDDFTKADAAGQKQMLMGGQFTHLFAKSPGLFKDVMEQFSLNPSLSPDERSQVDRLLGHATIDNFYARKAYNEQAKFAQAGAALFDGPGKDLVSSITNQLQIPAENAPDAVRFVKAGSVAIDDNGYVKKDPISGQDVLIPKQAMIENPDAVKDNWYAISTRKGSEGLVIKRDVSKDEKGSVDNFISQRSLQTGQQAQWAKGIYDDKLKAKQGGAQQQSSGGFPTFNNPGSTAQPEAAAPAEDPFKAAFSKNLNLAPPVAEKVAPTLDTLHRKLQTYAAKPLSRAEPATVKDINSTVNTIAKNISDAEFDSDPAIQAQYTQSHVESFNAYMADFTDNPAFQTLPPSVRDSYQSLADAGQVDSAKELYYVNRSGTLRPKIATLVFQMLSGALEQQNARASNAQKIGARNSYLQKVAANGFTTN